MARQILKHRLFKHIKQHPWLLLIAGILVVIVLFLCQFFIHLRHTAIADVWLDPAWTQQRSITINNTSNGSALTNYQVTTTINTAQLVTASLMKSDCSDLRVTDTDAITLLNFWIVDNTCNTTSTQIWVKVPSITASASKTIYLYYGNPAATALSSWSDIVLPYTDTMIKDHAAFSVRSSYASTVFDGKMWLMGGALGSTRYNDVYSSSDGITWTQTTAAAGWSIRNGLAYAALSFNNKLWFMGGFATTGSYQHDVWNTTDGVTWTQVTAAASWPARNNFGTAVFNNKMWVFGGFSSVTGRLNDVWNSDDGITWTQVTANAGWTARNSFGTTVFNNKMWIIGGLTGSGNMSDVWSSSDGITWTQETASAAFGTRRSSFPVVYDNRMWIFGGFTTAETNDVWYSMDGVTWTQATAAAGWTARVPIPLVLGNYLYLPGGGQGNSSTGANDVWQALRMYTTPAPIITLVADTTAPSIPGTPSTTTPTTDTTPTWTWSASADQGIGLASPIYTIEWATDAGFTTDFNASTATSNTFTHTTPLTETTWYVRAKATDVSSNVSAYSSNGSVVVDTTAPSSVGVPTFPSATISSVTIEKPTTVTESGSGLNTWQVRRNGSTELGFNPIATTTVADSALSENTQYAYDVQFKDAANNVSAYGTTASKYTLVNAPSHLASGSVSRNTVTLSVNAFPNDTSGGSGYYFSRTGANSGWIQTTSWVDNTVFCGTTYAYSVKFRNGDSVETDTASISQQTNACEGRGGTGANNPVTLPSTPISLAPTPSPEPEPSSPSQPTITPAPPVNPSSSLPTVDTTTLPVARIKEGTLFKYPDDPRIYVLENGLKTQINSPKDFVNLGYNWEDVQTLSPSHVVPTDGRKVLTTENQIPFTQNLSIGASGSDVRALQIKLQTLGYFPTNVNPSGYYGPVTVAAVKAFQTANNLESVGQVGPRTRALLNVK